MSEVFTQKELDEMYKNFPNGIPVNVKTGMHYKPGETPEEVLEDFNKACEDIKKKHEKVDHPHHYNQGNLECWDVMMDVFGTWEVLWFCKLNAFKYLWRSDQKNGIEDIKKAQVYLNKYIEIYKKAYQEEV